MALSWLLVTTERRRSCELKLIRKGSGILCQCLFRWLVEKAINKHCMNRNIWIVTDKRQNNTYLIQNSGVLSRVTTLHVQTGRRAFILTEKITVTNAWNCLSPQTSLSLGTTGILTEYPTSLGQSIIIDHIYQNLQITLLQLNWNQLGVLTWRENYWKTTGLTWLLVSITCISNIWKRQID